MEINSTNRRKRMMVWISEEEKVLVAEKAKYYGYKRIGHYIRDAAIYEKVTYVNIAQKEEIYEAYSMYTKEIKKILKTIRYNLKYITQISSNEINIILELLIEVAKNQRAMMNLIEKKLDLDVFYKINREVGK